MNYNMNRKEQIKIEADQYADKNSPNNASALLFHRFRFSFEKGAEWADNNPDQEGISKFTSNLMDENLKLTKQLTIAVEALKANANEDFRGNRSSESVRSFHALKKIEELKCLK